MGSRIQIVKLDIATQWVRWSGAHQVPPAQSLANRVVVNSMCVAVRQGAELEESRAQAVLLSSENGIFADKRQPQLLKSSYFIPRKWGT